MGNKFTCFTELFEKATFNPKTEESFSPFPYQIRLAEGGDFPSLVSIPTGLGKTAAIVLAWLWRRCFAADNVKESTPRRLVYCLPMRVLVEQTITNTKIWLGNLGLLSGEDLKDPSNGIGVYALMGGTVDKDWDIYPERDAILVGTQDMLLSRALNRGYAMSRYRWPIQFGLLNNDCLWVMDEVQLMGSGLTTSVQLDAFAKKLWQPVKPSRFIWMSATLDPSFLHTRDREDWGIVSANSFLCEKDDYLEPGIQERLQANKSIEIIKTQPDAKKILESHQRGRISLLILNTVSAARELFMGIQKHLADEGKNGKAGVTKPALYLIHSRFRPMDREKKVDDLLLFLNKMGNIGIVPNSEGLIVVTTQVIEAGFDLSSAKLWSEIAPWPSIIQRLGRLNRKGRQPDASASFWMPKAININEKKARSNTTRIGPYEQKVLRESRNLLEELISVCPE